MFKFLLSLINPLERISSDLKDAYTAKLNAGTDKERIAADERISTLEARKQIVLASSTNPVGRWVCALYATPFIVYNAKVIVWDKVLGLGVTDNLSPDFWYISGIVLGGYFIDSAVKRFTGR